MTDDKKITDSELEKQKLALIKKFTKNEGGDEDSGGGDSDKKDDDDAPNFIKKDDKEQTAAQKRDAVFQGLESLLKSALDKLEGIRPEGNRQRNLDRETGGVEAQADKGISDPDVWDKRPDEINKMIQDTQDLNNATKSSREQSLIHRDKQHKIHEKRMEKEKDGAQAHLSYVQQVNRFRNAKVDDGQDIPVDNNGDRSL